MVRIRCVNPKCTSPTKSFEWDESQHVGPGGGMAQPYEEDAVRVIAVCPYCTTQNAVWVKGTESDDYVVRE